MRTPSSICLSPLYPPVSFLDPTLPLIPPIPSSLSTVTRVFAQPMSARGHSLDGPDRDEFAVHACFLNVPVAAQAFNESSEINLMSVHGIVEQYPGGPCIRHSHVIMRKAAATERFLRDTSKSSGMLNSNNISAKSIRAYRRK